MFNIHSTLTAILLNVLEKHHVGFDSLLEYPLSKECLSLAGLNTSVEYAHLYAIWDKREFAWGQTSRGAGSNPASPIYNNGNVTELGRLCSA